jgi:hypothetical protein
MNPNLQSAIVLLFCCLLSISFAVAVHMFICMGKMFAALIQFDDIAFVTHSNALGKRLLTWAALELAIRVLWIYIKSL